MGWENDQYLTNPGSVGEAANRATGVVVAGVDTAARDWIDEMKGKVMKTFSDSSFDPDSQEIYENRQDIKNEFRSQYINATANGGDIDPLVAERLEQLREEHPHEVGQQFSDALDKVLENPQDFGLKTESPGFFSDNKGVEFSPG